jgi:hypothetical protein
MADPFIQGGSDGEKDQPATEEEGTPFRADSLNQQSSDDGTH